MPGLFNAFAGVAKWNGVVNAVEQQLYANVNGVERYALDWSGNEKETIYDALFFLTGGASGAIYGLLVAFAFMFPNAELMMMFIPVPVKAKYFVPVIVLLDLFSGVTGFSLFGGNIAHFAHVGGALIGFIMMWYWKKNQFDKNRWDR